MKNKDSRTILNAFVLTLLIGLTTSMSSHAQQKCSDVIKSIPSLEANIQVASDWLALESRLSSAKNLKEISNIEIGDFIIVRENLIRQKEFLDMTIRLAEAEKISIGQLQVILSKIKKALNDSSISYAHNWLIHYAMQEVADFHFSLLAESNAKLDMSSIHYLVKRLSQSNVDLAKAIPDSNDNNRVQRSFRLMHHYTDFHNPRYSESRRAQILGQERIPMPFFQRGFDISELNQLAITGRIRPVEIMSGVLEINQEGIQKLTAPIVDNRRMGVGKDASDHDFNHLGFEVSAQATRDLGRIMFEGSEKLSPEGLVVLNVIFFKAWHEWGSNLSSMGSGTQWPMLLNASHLRAEMTNPHYLGGDPGAMKSIDAIDSTVEFLKKKTLPSFWQ